jgi:hypothetical protein
MRKALLIGNGPSALEKELGSRIDSDEFDKVIRFNRWKFDEDGTEYNNDFSKFVGTRCDYWVINDLHLTETKIGINKRDLYEMVLVVIPNFKLDPNKTIIKNTESTYSNIKFIPSEYEDGINSIENFKPSWPSTGIVGMHFAIHHFDEVYLYGFDVYDTKYNTMHYFEGEDATYGRNVFKFKKRTDHTPDKEKKYMKYIMDNFNVKIL